MTVLGWISRPELRAQLAREPRGADPIAAVVCLNNARRLLELIDRDLSSLFPALTRALMNGLSTSTGKLHLYLTPVHYYYYYYISLSIQQSSSTIIETDTTS